MNLVPKNWVVFQHYKNRRPPWIKLHRELLENRDFITLPLASKALAPLLWLLASESSDGIFDATTEELSFRLRMSEKEVESGLKPLIQKGFFLDASTMLAPCLQLATPETETEKSQNIDRFAEFWNLYPRKIGKPKAHASWKAVTKLSESKQQEVLDGLKKHLPSLNGKEQQFVPHPTTWLNQHRWADPVEMIGQSKAEFNPYAGSI